MRTVFVLHRVPTGIIISFAGSTYNSMLCIFVAISSTIICSDSRKKARWRGENSSLKHLKSRKGIHRMLMYLTTSLNILLLHFASVTVVVVIVAVGIVVVS